MSGIADITPMTLLDYPDRVACIIWFPTCLLRCQYCYNTSFLDGSCELYSEREAIDFLTERAGFLEGVVFSGGECTTSPLLIPLAKKAKELGYLVKIDTNGVKPEVVKALVQENLVNYIALDYKAPKDLYEAITGRGDLYASFSETLDFLINESKIPFEVRTTVHEDLLDENDIVEINKDLSKRGYKGTYYLQHYFHTEDNCGHLSEPTREYNLEKLTLGNIPVELRNFEKEY